VSGGVVAFRPCGWDLWFRDEAGRERTERFAGGTPKHPPAAALDRQSLRGSQLLVLCPVTFARPHASCGNPLAR
jgi:hypothetical protein